MTQFGILVIGGILLAVVLLAFYFSFIADQRRHVERAWRKLLHNVRKQQDLAALLVELVRKEGQLDDNLQSTVEDLIAHRNHAYQFIYPSYEARKQAEKFEQSVEVFLSGIEGGKAEKMTEVLEASSEFHELESQIATGVALYHEALEAYEKFTFGNRPKGYGRYE